MSLTYIASESLMVLCPSVAFSIGEAAVAIASQFNGLVSLSALWSVTPPDLASILVQLENAITGMQLAVSLGLPSISFDIAATATLVAKINAGFGLLGVLEGLLSASIGLFSYSYTGNGNALGAAITSALATQWPDGTPTSSHVDALIFGADIAVPTAAIKGFFGGLSFGAGLQYGGKIGLDVLTPVTLQATSQGLPALEAQLSGALALLASLKVAPPTFDVIIPQLEFKLNVSDLLPKIDFVLGAMADAIARLIAKFNLLIELGTLLAQASATMFVYRYSGPANAMGPAMTSALTTTWGDMITPTSGPCIAVMLGAVDSLTLTIMNAFFGGA